MARDEEADDDAMPGQDSFIDVICNMVGILITLVVVVGMRVSQMVIDAPTELTPAVARASSTADVAQLNADLDAALKARWRAEEEIATAMHQAVDLRVNSALVEARREQLSLLRAKVEQEIAERRAKLDSDAQQQFDAQRQIAEAKVRLSELTQEQLSLLGAPQKVEEIESVPTPLAKEIGDEVIHIRLKHGLMAVIPVDALLQTAMVRGRDYVRNTLRERGQVTDVFGPIDGFRMRLLAARYDEPMPQNRPSRTVMRLRFVFSPTADDVGIAMEQALLPNSPLMRALRERRSARPTVAVWVYPDSYAELRSLKKVLWEAGIPLTVQPRREGEFIGMAVGEGFKPMAQ